MLMKIKYDKPKKLACLQSAFIKSPYHTQVVNMIRGLPSRTWHPNEQMWEIPADLVPGLLKILPKMVKTEITGTPSGTDEGIGDKKYRLPKILKTKPYPFQEEDFNLCMNHDKFLLLYSMGLGKSLLSIMIAVKRRELKQVKHCLIVCGVNTIKYNYQAEVLKHTGLNAIILGNRQNKFGVWNTKGTKEKLEDLDNLSEFFIITNVESLRNKDIKDKVKKLLDKSEIGMIVCDEIHKISNPGSQQGRALLLLAKHSKYFLGLTGTVLSNSPLDAYVPLKCVGREIATFSQFKFRYCVFGGFGNFAITAYQNVNELQYKLDKAGVRRLKSDVLDLPPKIYTDEYLEMGAVQTKLYSDVLKAILEDIDKVALSVDPLGQLIRLRQVTASAAILSEKYDESVKLDRLDEILLDLKGKAIIFSNWTTVTDIVYKRLAKYNPALITGQVKNREIEQKKFMEDDSCKVIICTTAAAGVGLTLTAADTVIFLDEPWTKAAKEQAEDRAHRIGTKGSVNIITLMCKGTIDEYIHKVVAKKGVMSSAFIDHEYDLNDVAVLKFILTGEGKI